MKLEFNKHTQNCFIFGLQIKAFLGLLIYLGISNSPGYAQESFLKGITFGGQLWPEENLQFVDYNLDRLHQFGFNTIVLVTNWYVDDYTDPNVKPFYRHESGFPNTNWFSPTLYDSEIRDIISKAKSEGYEIVLKPHVDPLDTPFGGVGRWGLQKDTGKWDELFESYSEFILHYAQIAEEMNVKLLVIGCELESMTHSWSGITDADSRWRQIISDIRSIYNGKLTYSCSFHGNRNDTWSSPNNITFWDALDYIGFELYRGLTVDNRNPSLDELKAGVEDVFENYMKPLSDQYNKKVLIPEINYYAFDGVNTNPLADPAVSNFLPDNSSPDPQEQADCYQAVLEVLYEKYGSNYIAGILWWPGYLINTNEINPNASNEWALEDKYDWIWFKPVEGILKQYWLNQTDISEIEYIEMEYSLEQNYPNPFNPRTTVEFILPVTGKVKFEIYNILGQRVETLLNKELNAGLHKISWNAHNRASGTYFYKISVPNFIQVKKMLLVK